MANGREVDTESVFESILGIANRVLEKSEMKDTELYEQYKDVREYLKSQPIYITPNVKAEIISQFGDYKSFRNLLMGKVNRISNRRFKIKIGRFSAAQHIYNIIFNI